MICDERFWMREKKGVKCMLCPNFCLLKDGMVGKCKVRQNINNKLYLINYGCVISSRFDDLSNRPIYKYKKNNKSLTIGLSGCNNTCPFCQNYMISQKSYIDTLCWNPEDVLKLAKDNGVNFVSFTFTEPIVWVEYFLDTAKILKKNGFKICLKTSGYMSENFHSIILEQTDAINIDIKPNIKSYLKKCGIKESDVPFKMLKNAVGRKIIVELSYIVIEGLNDKQGIIDNFIETLFLYGLENVPIHFLKHYPSWKSNYSTTKTETLIKCKEYAVERFLKLGKKNPIIYTKDIE